MSNIPSEHKTLILETLKMKASMDEKKDLDKMRRDRLTMLKNNRMETYAGFRELKYKFNTLMNIADFLSGKNG
jgi:hypothetical protein